MALYCYSEVMLAHFTDLLHDLWFDWPDQGFKPQDGRLSITLLDKDLVLDKERMLAFRLCIHEIEAIEIEGRPGDLPGGEEFNRLKWQKRDSLLIIENCLATKIKCRVKKLHLELEQVT